MNTIGIQQQTDGSFIEVNLVKRIVFTPTVANRWYRIVVSNEIISGELRIVGNHTDRKTDASININATTSSRPHLSQISHTVKGGENLAHEVQSSIGGGHVTSARAARRQGASQDQLVFDILVIRANEELTLEATGSMFPDFITAPEIIGTGSDEYNGITGSDSESLANTLELGIGVRSNLELRHHHGHRADPQQPLRISGRAGYLHALNLRGGAGKFTASTDHFHVFWLGGTNSGSGRNTPQYYTTWPQFNNSNLNKWNTWQLQNGNSTNNNEIFLGGVTEFVFGESEIGSALKYGIDTTRIDETGIGNSADPANPNTNPGAPLYEGEVDFYFNSTFSINNETYVTATFPVGVAGIAAAILGGKTVGTVAGPLTAPDGATGKFKLTIKLEGLGNTEWNPAAQAFATTPINWQIKTVTPPIPHQVSLVTHSTRRDKLIATYSQPHNILQGQVVVLNLLQKCFVVTTPARSNCFVSKVIDSTTLEITFGTCRRLENYNAVGVFAFSHNAGSTVKNNDSFQSDLYWVNGVDPNYIANDGNPVLRVKLFSSGKLPNGLEAGRDYWMRLDATYPHYFFRLYNTENDANVNNTATAVQVQWKPAYGAHYLEFQDIEPLGPTGWSVHIGNTDAVHQQTFADAGWHMHRNIFPDAKGIAQGVISQGVYGGLNEVQWFRQKAFAYGWNCSAENDNAVALGIDVKNNTVNSVEVGYDNTKVRFSTNTITLSANTVELGSVKFTGDVISSNAAQETNDFLKIIVNNQLKYIRLFDI